MKYSFVIFFFLSSAFLFMNCSDERTINDKEKFAKIYVDLLINEEQNRTDSLKLKTGKEDIFKKYGVNQNQYNATIDYYNKDPERWRDFFTKVNAYFDKIANKPKSR
jgi:hypothetical protein